MINILLSKYNISQKWCIKELQNYIPKGARVAVVAFSFRDEEIADELEWNKYYGAKGFLSNAIEAEFKPYGIGRENIEYINYFRDNAASAKQKLENADIIYFPGGLKARKGEPDRIMTRAIEFDLLNTIEAHRGIVIGFGAGAQVQIANYYIAKKGRRMSPGLGFRFVEGFDIVPNYTNEEAQNYFIKRVVTETSIPVYAIGEEGAIVVNNGQMSIIGDVNCFRKKA
jgi:peptidase E